jgi:hypothetical protein
MDKAMIKIVNVQTGEELEREMTVEELSQLESDATNNAAKIKKQAAKDAARQAVLDKLGLSADEVAALLG